MVTGVAYGLQNRCEAFTRLGWVRFPHVPAILVPSILAFAFCLVPVDAAGQDPVVPDSVVPAPAVTDSLLVGADAGAETVSGSTLETADLLVSASAPIDSLPPVTALSAFARSIVLPGWGQLTVGRPERGAIYFGAEAVFLYMVFKSSQKLNVAKRAENQGLIESRTRQRENWIVLAGFVAFMSGIDAWVSTHFWDYEPSITAPPDGSVGVSVGFKVNLP